jgi:hypothetical protein
LESKIREIAELKNELEFSNNETLKEFPYAQELRDKETELTEVKTALLKDQVHNTPEKKFLFEYLTTLFPEIMNGEKSYIKLESSQGFMPLTVESFGNDTISLAHHYEQNGDLMCDPLITFKIDKIHATASAAEYRQDGNPPIYQVYEGGEAEQYDIEDFAVNTWLPNIESQGYLRVEAPNQEHSDVQFTLDGVSDTEVSRHGDGR